MCTTRCSVRLVKHEPIDSQRIQFETLFSVMSWLLKSPWTVEFEQTIQAFVIQLYEMNLRNTKSQLSLGENTLLGLSCQRYGHWATVTKQPPLSLLLYFLFCLVPFIVWRFPAESWHFGWKCLLVCVTLEEDDLCKDEFRHICVCVSCVRVHVFVCAWVCAWVCLSLKCFWNAFGTSRQSELTN